MHLRSRTYGVRLDEFKSGRRESIIISHRNPAITVIEEREQSDLCRIDNIKRARAFSEAMASGEHTLARNSIY